MCKVACTEETDNMQASQISEWNGYFMHIYFHNKSLMSSQCTYMWASDAASCFFFFVTESKSFVTDIYTL